MPSSSSQKSVADSLEVKVAGITVDALGRKWDPSKHPRDSHGRFIETGGIVRAGLGGLAKVVRTKVGGKIEVEFPNGVHRDYPHEQLTMVRRPDGSKPTKSVAKVVKEDALREKHPQRGDGKRLPDLNPDLPVPATDPADEHVNNPDDGDTAKHPVPEAYSPSRQDAREGDLIALTAPGKDGQPRHILARVEQTDGHGKPEKIRLAGTRGATMRYDDPKIPGDRGQDTVLPREDLKDPARLFADAADPNRPERPAPMDNEEATDLVEGHAKETAAKPSTPDHVDVTPDDVRMMPRTNDGSVEVAGRKVGTISKNPDGTYTATTNDGKKLPPSKSWDTSAAKIARHVNKNGYDGAPQKQQPVEKTPPAARKPRTPKPVVHADPTGTPSTSGATTRTTTDSGKPGYLSESGNLLAVKEGRGWSIQQAVGDNNAPGHETVNGHAYRKIGAAQNLGEFREKFMGNPERDTTLGERVRAGAQQRDDQTSAAGRYSDFAAQVASAQTPAELDALERQAAQEPDEQTRAKMLRNTQVRRDVMANQGPPADTQPATPATPPAPEAPAAPESVDDGKVEMTTATQEGRDAITRAWPPGEPVRILPAGDGSNVTGADDKWSVVGPTRNNYMRVRESDHNTTVDVSLDRLARREQPTTPDATSTPPAPETPNTPEAPAKRETPSQKKAREWLAEHYGDDREKLKRVAAMTKAKPSIRQAARKRLAELDAADKTPTGQPSDRVKISPEQLAAETNAPKAPKPAPTTPHTDTSHPEGAAPDEQPVRRPGPKVLADVPAEPVRDNQRPGDVLPQPERPGGRADRADATDTPHDSGRRDTAAGDRGTPGSGSRGQGAGAGRPRVPAAGAGDTGPSDGRGDSAGVAGRPAADTGGRRSQPVKPAQAFKAGSQADLAQKGEKAKLAGNMAAIRTLKQIEAEGRAATPAEQKVLARWAGWGALPKVFDESDPTYAKERDELKSLLTPAEWVNAKGNVKNAHYTDHSIVTAMWDGLKKLGFTKGDVLEAGSGSGNFIGAAPDGVHMTGVELDPITAGISRQLYPQADIHNESFAKSPFRDGVFDAMIGNVPFGSYPLLDKRHNKGNHSIHNHFIIKGLHELKPGGVMAVVTSSFTLDGHDEKARREMYDQADLIGAVRLPENSHSAAADTSVVTDMLLFRKRKPGEKPGDASWLHASPAVDKAGNPVVGTARKGEEPKQQVINDYFTKHPDDMLGELKSGGYNGLKVVGDGNTQQKMVERLDKLANQAKKDGHGFAATPDDPARKVAKRDSGNHREGRIFYTGTHEVERGAAKKRKVQEHVFERIEDGRRVKFDVPSTQAEEFKSLLGLRDLYDALLTAEREAGTDDDPTMDAARSALRNAYRSHVKTHGAVTRHELVADPEGDVTPKYPPVMGKFRQDEGSAIVFGLEKAYDPTTKSAAESDILTTRQLNSARKAADHTDDPVDAVALAAERPGGVTPKNLAAILGTTPVEARKRVAGHVFEDPATGRLVPKAEYLSGNVRQKLAEAREKAADNPALAENVKALEEVLPADAELSDVPLALGSTFIKPDLVQQFAKHLMGSGQNGVEVIHDRNGWQVKTPKNKYGRNPVLEKDTWGTDRRDFYTLLEKVLRGQHHIIRVTDKDPEGGTVYNKKASEEAQLKAAEIAQEFEDWVWANPHIADRLTKEYTEKHRSVVPRSYDGSPERAFPGMAAEITLRKHQNDGVTRAVNEPAVMFDHVVGSGKTYTLAATAMELKRLGLVQKPVLAVPKPLLGQWAKEFRELYPDAKILAADSDAIKGKDGRKRFAAMVANNDWDIIIMPHNTFGSIPVSAEYERRYLDRELAKFEDQKQAAIARGESKATIKQIETAKAKLEAKIEERLKRRKDDHGITFETLGIDYIMGDEAHTYKNLDFATNLQGVSPPEGSGLARDMHMKLELLREKKAGEQSPRVAAFATGTPISNSLSEMYAMTQFLRPDLLEEAGISDFDSWASVFAKVSAKTEQDTSASGWVERVRLRGFTDALGDALRIWRTFTDTKTADDLNLPRPKLKGGERKIHVVQPSEDQLRALASFKDRVETLPPGPPKEGDDTHVAIIGDGRRAAVDPRLMSARGLARAGIDKNGDGEPSPKIQEAASEILRIWKEHKDDRFKVKHDSNVDAELPGALQMVMVDADAPKKGQRSSSQMLKDLLVAGGMPENEVRFIQEAAGSAEKKDRMQEDARQGRISVLMGSTESLGTGTNVQNRLYALHHIDGAWKPSAIEQREGRIIRQGSQFDQVEIHTYVTERTHDVKTWDMTSYKQAALDAIKHGSYDMRGVEFQDDVDPLTDYDTITGLASGDPLVQDRRDLKPVLDKLVAAERSHRRSLDRARGQADEARLKIGILERRRDLLQGALARREDVSGNNFKMGVNRNSYSTPDSYASRKDAAKALGDRLNTLLDGDAYVPDGEYDQGEVGTLGGFTIRASTQKFRGQGTKIKLELTDKGGRPYGRGQVLPLEPVVVSNADLKGNMDGVVTRLTNRVEGIGDAIHTHERGIENTQGELGAAEANMGRRFRYADDLANAQRQAALLDKILTKKFEEGENPNLLRSEYADAKAKSKEAEARDKAERLAALKAQKAEKPDAPAVVATPDEVAQGDAELAAEVDAAKTPRKPRKPGKPKPAAPDQAPTGDTAPGNGPGAPPATTPAEPPAEPLDLTADTTNDLAPEPAATQAELDAPTNEPQWDPPADPANPTQGDDIAKILADAKDPESAPQPVPEPFVAPDQADVSTPGQATSDASGPVAPAKGNAPAPSTDTPKAPSAPDTASGGAGQPPTGTPAAPATPDQPAEPRVKVAPEDLPTVNGEPAPQATTDTSTAGAETDLKEVRDAAEKAALDEGATRKEAESAADAAEADEATADATVDAHRPIPPGPGAVEELGYEPKTPVQLEGEKHPLTPQQQRIADAVVADGKDTIVKAKAGAGKTSTLEAIARRFQAADPNKKIIYIAFNKSVQVEAEGRMPSNVESRTGHSLAWSYVGPDINGKRDRKGMLRRGDELAKFLGINERMGGDDGLKQAQQAQAAMKTVDTYANSADDKIGMQHLPVTAAGLSDGDKRQLLKYANKLWDDLKSKDGKVAISFDHMRKMWALSKPDLTKTSSGAARAGAGVLFLDEAQDTPPVLAKVVADQKMQKVIVGDADQAIYGFTGATDYLDTAEHDVDLPLTKSFRFGPAVADWGNRFLQVLGSKERVIGAGGDSQIVNDMEAPDAILTRSNGGMIGEILREQEAGRRVGVPKGTKADLLSLVETARYLRGEGEAPARMHEDLAPFLTWAEFQEAADRGDDPKLTMLKGIIDKYDLDGLDRIVGQVSELADGPLPDVMVTKGDDGIRLRGRTWDHLDKIKQAGFRFREVPGAGNYKSGKNKGKPIKAWYAPGDTPEAQQAALDRLKELGTGPDPDVIVSTAHKAKGLEWGRVRIGTDFKGPREDQETGDTIMPDPEELRLAYVAVTRAEKELDPGSLRWVEDYSNENGDGEGPRKKVNPADLPTVDGGTPPKPREHGNAPGGGSDTPNVNAPDGSPAGAPDGGGDRTAYGVNLDTISDADLDAKIADWQDRFDRSDASNRRFNEVRLNTFLAERDRRHGQDQKDDSHTEDDLGAPTGLEDKPAVDLVDRPDLPQKERDNRRRERRRRRRRRNPFNNGPNNNNNNTPGGLAGAGAGLVPGMFKTPVYGQGGNGDGGGPGTHPGAGTGDAGLAASPVDAGQGGAPDTSLTGGPYDENGMGPIVRAPGLVRVDTALGEAQVSRGDDGAWHVTYPGQDHAADTVPTLKAGLASVRAHTAQNYGTPEQRAETERLRAENDATAQDLVDRGVLPADKPTTSGDATPAGPPASPAPAAPFEHGDLVNIGHSKFPWEVQGVTGDGQVRVARAGTGESSHTVDPSTLTMRLPVNATDEQLRALPAEDLNHYATNAQSRGWPDLARRIREEQTRRDNTPDVGTPPASAPDTAGTATTAETPAPTHDRLTVPDSGLSSPGDLARWREEAATPEGVEVDGHRDSGRYRVRNLTGESAEVVAPDGSVAGHLRASVDKNGEPQWEAVIGDRVVGTAKEPYHAARNLAVRAYWDSRRDNTPDAGAPDAGNATPTAADLTGLSDAELGQRLREALVGGSTDQYGALRDEFNRRDRAAAATERDRTAGTRAADAEKGPRPSTTDGALNALGEVATRFARGHDQEGDGASKVGLNPIALRKALKDGLLEQTDTGTSDTEGGRHRLHLTDAGREQLRRAVAHRMFSDQGDAQGPRNEDVANYLDQHDNPAAGAAAGADRVSVAPGDLPVVADSTPHGPDGHAGDNSAGTGDAAPAGPDTRPEPLVNGNLPNPDGMTLPTDASGDYSPEQIQYLADNNQQVVINAGGQWHAGYFRPASAAGDASGDGGYLFDEMGSNPDTTEPLRITPDQLHEVRGMRQAEIPGAYVDPGTLRPGTRVTFQRGGRLNTGVLTGVNPDGRAVVRDATGAEHETTKGGKVRPIIGAYLPGAEPTERPFAPEAGVWSPTDGGGVAAGVPGEWVAGVSPKPDGTGFRWQVQGAPGSGLGGETGESGTLEDAKAQVDDVLSSWALDTTTGDVSTLPGDNRADSTRKSAGLADQVRLIRGDTADATPADETAGPPTDVGGQPAAWVPTGELVPGDIARVDGDDGNGSATTRTGHVLGTPEPVTVHSPGTTPEKGTRTPIGEHHDGSGDRGTVLSPDESVAARASRDEKSGDGSNPASAAESNVLTGKVGDTVPAGDNGLGVFPNSVVTDRNGRQGVVTETTPLDVAVRWAGKKRDERVRPGLLTVDPDKQQRPEGWTKTGQQLRAGLVVEAPDGSKGPIESLNGDQVAVITPDGFKHLDAADLKVIGQVKDDEPTPGREPWFDAPVGPEGRDIRPAAPVKPVDLPDGATTATPNLRPEHLAALNDLGLDIDATSDMDVQQAAARLRHGLPISDTQAQALADHLRGMVAEKSVPAGKQRQIKRVLNRLDTALDRAHAGGTHAAAPEPVAGEPVLAKVADLVVGDVIAVPNAQTGQVEVGTIIQKGAVTNARGMDVPGTTQVTLELPDGQRVTRGLTDDGNVYRLPDLPVDPAGVVLPGAPDPAVDPNRPFTEPRVAERLDAAAEAVVDSALGQADGADSIDALGGQVAAALDDNADAPEQHNSGRRLGTSLDQAGVNEEAAQAAHDAAQEKSRELAQQVADRLRRTFDDATNLPGESNQDAAARWAARLRGDGANFDRDQVLDETMQRAAGLQLGAGPADAPSRLQQAHARRDVTDALRADLFAFADRLAELGDTEGANTLSKVAARLAGHPDETHVDAAVKALAMRRRPGMVRSFAARVRAMFARQRARFLDRVRSMMGTGRKAKRSLKAAIQAARAEWAGDDRGVRSLVGDAAKHLATGGDGDGATGFVVEPDVSFAEKLAHFRENLPADGRFGHVETTTPAYTGLTVDRLTSGQLLRPDPTPVTRLDRAADGGPGQTALDHLAAVKGMGSVVDREVAARVRAAAPDLGDDPAATVREARRYAVEVGRDERSNLGDTELTDLRRKAIADATDKAARYATARAEAVREVLGDVRSIGPRGAAKVTVRGRSGTAPEVKALEWAQSALPTDWLTTGGTVDALASRMSGYDGNGTILVAPLGASPVPGAGEYGASALHGLGHHLTAAVPGLRDAAWAYQWSRTSTGDTGRRTRRGRNALARLRDLFPAVGYDRDELVRPGDYEFPQMGADDASEVVALGLQSLFAGDAYLDDDGTMFLLGLLAWLSTEGNR